MLHKRGPSGPGGHRLRRRIFATNQYSSYFTQSSTHLTFMNAQAAVVDVQSLSRRDTVISILIIGLLFFIFGFVSWVNAILIPYFKIACELTSFQSYLVAFAFYISYFIMSVPASYLLKAVGFKKGMMFGFW